MRAFVSLPLTAIWVMRSRLFSRKAPETETEERGWVMTGPQRNVGTSQHQFTSALCWITEEESVEKTEKQEWIAGLAVAPVKVCFKVLNRWRPLHCFLILIVEHDYLIAITCVPRVWPIHITYQCWTVSYFDCWSWRRPEGRNMKIHMEPECATLLSYS